MKITGYEKALKEYREWKSIDRRYYASIMLDRYTGEVWCDTFTDCNSWEEYDDPAIINMGIEIAMRCGDFTVNATTVKEVAEILCDEYAKSNK